MNELDVIKMRRSIRSYSQKEISDEVLHDILEAGMSGPSCVNAKDWSFIVVRDKETLNKMAAANGKPADPLKTANVGILVCGDLERSFLKAQDYWIIDCSIACQNIVLSARNHNIGSVWLGTYPQMERVDALKKLFELPETIIPHSIISLGYPLDEGELQLGSRSHYEDTQVHFEKW